MTAELDTVLEPWRRVWREGVVPQLTRDNLEALRDALERDDPRLLQGVTMSPPPMQCVAGWPIEGACLLAYMVACEQGGFGHDVGGDGKVVYPARSSDGTVVLARGGAALVADVEDGFAQLCHECDTLLGEAAACRWLLNYWDETPREEAIHALLLEVEYALELLDTNP